MNFDVISPETATDLIEAIKSAEGYVRFGAGCTDLLPEIRKFQAEGLTVINLARMNDPEFCTMRQADEGYQIGALVTAASIEEDNYVKVNYPVLYQAASTLASGQIREVATIGGNLCTASPSGDIACALVALGASCEIMNESGSIRWVSVREFFTGPRRTVMLQNEILRKIRIPVGKKLHNLYSGFIKVGTRRSMECSVVSLAYHLPVDAENKFYEPGLAIGAVAPTIMYPESACRLLEGKRIEDLTDSDMENFADRVLDYASPISDIRGSAWYRMAVLKNISKGIFNTLQH